MGDLLRSCHPHLEDWNLKQGFFSRGISPLVNLIKQPLKRTPALLYQGDLERRQNVNNSIPHYLAFNKEHAVRALLMSPLD